MQELLTPHSSLLTPHSSLLTPHSSLLTSSTPAADAGSPCLCDNYPSSLGIRAMICRAAPCGVCRVPPATSKRLLGRLRRSVRRRSRRRRRLADAVGSHSVRCAEPSAGASFPRDRSAHRDGGSSRLR